MPKKVHLFQVIWKGKGNANTLLVKYTEYEKQHFFKATFTEIHRIKIKYLE